MLRYIFGSLVDVFNVRPTDDLMFQKPLREKDMYFCFLCHLQRIAMPFVTSRVRIAYCP